MPNEAADTRRDGRRTPGLSRPLRSAACSCWYSRRERCGVSAAPTSSSTSKIAGLRGLAISSCTVRRRANLPPGAGDIAIHHAFEQRQRNVASLHDDVVIGLEVEARTQRRPGLDAQPVNLVVPHLVAARLAGHRTIALQLAGKLDGWHAGRFQEPGQRLYKCPALGKFVG